MLNERQYQALVRLRDSANGLTRIQLGLSLAETLRLATRYMDGKRSVNTYEITLEGLGAIEAYEVEHDLQRPRSELDQWAHIATVLLAQRDAARRQRDALREQLHLIQQPEPLQTDVMLNEDPHIEPTPTTPASVDAFLFDGLKAAAEHDAGTVDQATSAFDELAKLRAENNALRKQVADQQHELEVRAGILNLAVTAARGHGFKQNGWIDSINHLAKLAIYLHDVRHDLMDALICGLEVGGEVGALQKLINQRDDHNKQVVKQVVQRKEVEKERDAFKTQNDELLGALKPFAACASDLSECSSNAPIRVDVWGVESRLIWAETYPDLVEKGEWLRVSHFDEATIVYAKYAPKRQGDAD